MQSVEIFHFISLVFPAISYFAATRAIPGAPSLWTYAMHPDKVYARDIGFHWWFYRRRFFGYARRSCQTASQASRLS